MKEGKGMEVGGFTALKPCDVPPETAAAVRKLMKLRNLTWVQVLEELRDELCS